MGECCWVCGGAGTSGSIYTTRGEMRSDPVVVESPRMCMACARCVRRELKAFYDGKPVTLQWWSRVLAMAIPNEERSDGRLDTHGSD